MSFILDANYVITLHEIGILDSLLNLKEIVVPKIMCKEETKHIKDFLQLMKDNPKKFIVPVIAFVWLIFVAVTYFLTREFAP